MLCGKGFPQGVFFLCVRHKKIPHSNFAKKIDRIEESAKKGPWNVKGLFKTGSESMTLKKYSVYLSWIIVLIWMVLIFNFSAQPAETSNELSQGVTKVVVETVEKVTPIEEMKINLNHIIRKCAHFTVYLVLGILVLYAFRRSGVRGWKAFSFTLAICILYAISDEFHQQFVAGRGPQVKDVFIDSSGALVGIGLSRMAGLWKAKHA